jgi:hypothetical protein
MSKAITPITPAAIKEIVNTSARGVVDDVSDIINQLAEQFDGRFISVEAGIKGMNHGLSKVQKDFVDLRGNINRLTNTVDGFVKRLDENELEDTARDAQFRRLLDWAQKVSAKTGIPLEY